MKESVRYGVPERGPVARVQRGGEVRSAQPPAAERQVRDFLRGAEPPQLGIELQAIDDAGIRSEENVLRAQVAVAVDQPRGARDHERRGVVEECELRVVQRGDAVARQLEIRRAELTGT